MLASGVGQYPDSFALVGSAGVVSSKHSPSRIKPHRGQVGKNSSESPSSEHWRVFHVCVSRLNFANDAGHFHPQSASLSLDSGAFPGSTDVLTRKAARYNVNKPSPWASVKGPNVIPDWEGRENSVILSLGKNASGIGFPFDGANGAPSKQFAAEYSSTSAREKSQLIQSLLPIVRLLRALRG
jgi:hypothetical protein